MNKGCAETGFLTSCSNEGDAYTDGGGRRAGQGGDNADGDYEYHHGRQAKGEYRIKHALELRQGLHDGCEADYGTDSTAGTEGHGSCGGEAVKKFSPPGRSGAWNVFPEKNYRQEPCDDSG